MGLLSGIGRLIDLAGSTFSAPELGISERFGVTSRGDVFDFQGNNKPYTQGRTVNTANNPLKISRAPGGATETTIGDNFPTWTGTTGGSSGGGAGSAAAAANNAWWNDQLKMVDEQLGRIPGQESIGLGNILSSYNSAFQTLTNSKGRAKRDFDTARTDTQQENIKTRGKIDTGVRGQMTALQRLFGAKGAGSSSAANVLGPYAAALEGNSQRSEVQDVYGRNMRSIDTGWKDTEEDFETSFGQLSTDKVNRESSLRGGMATTRANLLAKKQQAMASMGLAPDAAITNEINSLGRQVDEYGRVQSFTPRAVQYKTPDMADYDYSATQGPEAIGGRDSAGLPGMGAYWTLLNGEKKKQPVQPALAVA